MGCVLHLGATYTWVNTVVHSQFGLFCKLVSGTGISRLVSLTRTLERSAGARLALLAVTEAPPVGRLRVVARARPELVPDSAGDAAVRPAGPQRPHPVH